MLVREACLDIESEATSEEVAEVLRPLTDGGPFVLSSVEPLGGGRHRCRFVLARPDLAVGYRSVIELQHRVDREFDIVSVDRQTSFVADAELVLS